MEQLERLLSRWSTRRKFFQANGFPRFWIAIPPTSRLTVNTLRYSFGTPVSNSQVWPRLPALQSLPPPSSPLHPSPPGGMDDHDRLRPLFYPETDVFIVAFGIDSMDSLDNVRFKWIPEIKHFCPKTPWLLVGMKSDLRSRPPQARYPHVTVQAAKDVAKDLGQSTVRYIKN